MASIDTKNIDLIIRECYNENSARKQWKLY